jgi:hypothetical protein
LLRARIGSATRVLECLGFEIEVFTNLINGRLRGHRGYTAIQAIPGVGPILGAVFVAEIGDVHRFPGPSQLSSRAGLTPKTTSPTPKFTADGSPSRAAPWSARMSRSSLIFGGGHDRQAAITGSS